MEKTEETCSGFVIRDRERIDQEYDGGKWQAIRQHLDSLAKQGETEPRRLIAKLKEFEDREQTEAPWQSVIEGQEFAVPGAYARGGYFSLISALIAGECSSDTDAVIELASGWGHNLLHLWYDGGPRDAQYLGLEISENARSCMETLSAKNDGCRLRPHEFDLARPNYSFLDQDAPSNAVVFSHNGIEQIPDLPLAIFEKLIERLDRVVGLHFEPIGWQIHAEQGLPESRGSSRGYAERNDYNRNLWPLLKDLEKKGMIEITDVRPDYLGFKKVNWNSLIKWRKRIS